MNKIVTAVCFILISAKTFCRGTCPLDSVNPTQNLTQMIGRWREYKKTTDFLASNVCTTYDVACPNNGNDGACNVNLLPNGTYTGNANTLIVSGTSTMWGNNTIYLNVNSTQQFVVLWDCYGEENKKYELAILMRDLSAVDTIKEINSLLDTITVDYKYELEVINNTLCNGIEKTTIHFTMFIVLTFRIFLNY